MASYADLKKRYSEGPSYHEKFREQYGGPIVANEAPEESKPTVIDRAGKAMEDLVAGIIPKAKTNAGGKPKHDIAAYNEAKAKEGYAKAQKIAADDKAVYDAGIAEIDALDEEDRRNLEKYVADRSSTQIANMFLGPQFDSYNLNPIVQKYGIGKVRQMAEIYERQQNEAAAKQVEQDSRDAVTGKVGNAFGQSTLSVGANLIGSATGVLGRVQEISNRTGQFSTLQQHTVGDLPSLYASTVREEITQNISGDEYDEAGNQIKEGGKLRQGIAIGYQGAMSAADSLARAMTTGAAAPALAAFGGFSQKVSEASKQGATPTQAMILGIGSAAIEAATEKVPLDNLLKAAKGGVKGVEAIAGNALRQAAIEAGEEEISLFANLLWEAAVLREKSSYKQRIGEAIANGATYEEAKAQADKEVWQEALNTAAVSASAGIFSGATSATYGSLFGSNEQGDVQTEQAAEAAPEAPVQPQQEQTTQEQAQPDAAQAAAQELTQAQQAEADAKAAQEQAQEAIAQGMAEEYGPMMPQAEPKSQMQQDIDNATAAMLAENGIGQTQQAEADTVANAQQETQPVTEQNPTEELDGEQNIKGTGAAEQNKSVGGMESQFKHEVKRSAIYDNTYKNSPNADVRLIGREAERQDPNIGQYDAITEKESLHEAELRTETGRDRYSEYRYLLGKDGWTGADNDTAAKLLDTYRREKKVDMFTALAKKQREMGTQAGQMVQSFAKYSRGNATDAATDAVLDLDNLTIDQIDTTFWNPKNEAKTTAEKKNALQKWKENVSTSLMEVADDIDNVEDGDIESIKGIVRQLANLRHTTAWAGYSNELTRRTERGLDKMDFETLKTVAKTQLSMVPNDFRKRKPAEIIKQMRMQNMLFTLTTKLKNDTGNISNGLMDAVSDSFGGRMMDAIIGKYTGMRTVANDLKYAAEYRKAAKDAADVAGAFVSLDIPMEEDAKYAVNRTRTWSPNTTNTLFRLASAFEKHLKYSLEVSDKFYEGGATHVVSKSLQGLGEKSGLTAEQIQDLARKTGERRTFKDPGYGTTKDGQPKNGRTGARVASGIQRALNEFGTEDMGAGDLIIPFAKVAAEVKQVGIDYTGSGMITGMGEMLSIIKDAKNGKEIDPYRQRSAATNFGRGMTGVALTALFTAMASVGIIKVHNDKNSKERTMDQAQGLSGAQWNLGSAIRWLEAVVKGATEEEALQAAKWQPGDELMTVDFLEPFNTQMHIGCLIAEGESIPKAVLKGNLDALLEMPMMQTFSDLADIQQAFTEVSEGDMSGVLDATGQLIGTVAGAAIPNVVRKAAQVIDPYYRDTYDTNPIKKAGKQLVAGIPFASQMLPKKYDNLGQEQRRYEEGDEINAAIDALVTPWDTDNYKTDPVYTEVERLNEALKNSDINVTPPQPKRKINYTDKTGVDHDGYVLTEEQYQKIAETQGQTAKTILDKLTGNADYKKLTDEQKAFTFQAVYQYAQEKGKQAAIPDYHSNADAWIADMREFDMRGFIAQGSKKALNNAIGNAIASVKNDWQVTEATKGNMEQAYDSFRNLSVDQQQRILDEVSSDTLKYIEARKAGATTQNYLDITRNVGNLGSNAKAADKYAAVAKTTGISDSAKDAMVKAYMTDYDPNAKSPNTTELKYDYAREELGLTAEEFAQVYRISAEDSKKAEKYEKWKNQGYSPAECDALWALFEDSGKKKTDVVAWHNSK